jgi:protein phosphatase
MNSVVEVRSLDKIVFPENTLVVLCGIAGCGKSTFAAKHFLPTQIVSSDECRARICDDETNQKVTGHAFELWRLIIRKRLLLGKLTVADATNLERCDREWLVKTAQYYHFLSAVILFDFPFKVCLTRNATRKRVVPEEALVKQYEFFQNTLASIKDEHFNSVYALKEKDLSLINIEIVSAVQL